MFSASVTNTNLIIYSPNTITGVNTSFLYVFDNNVFKKISASNFTASQVNITLANSVAINGNCLIGLYSGGIVTSGGLGLSIATTIQATNTTVFQDNTLPSLIEMIEQSSYNWTSYVYSNYNTGITTQANFPTASIILKRNPPQGAIIINEGYLGPMNVHRFAALSTTLFQISTGPTFSTLSHFAFNYHSYGDQQINSILFKIGTATTFKANSKAYITINEDYFNSPSSIIIGISTIIDFSFQQPQLANFAMIGTTIINQGQYWVVFTPTPDASFGQGNQIQTQSAVDPNYYSTELQISTDGLLWSTTPINGVGFAISTPRGIVLPSVDAIYNQLSQPQNIPVNYGDASNLNLYTLLAVPNTSHYIQKNLIDNVPIYSIDTLVNSNGQNQYQVSGINTSGFNEEFYTMISNSLTQNIVNYTFYEPVILSSLTLQSLGDYYALGPLGNILVSGQDFLGINRIDISNNINFPTNGTLTLYPNNLQQYLQNIPYDFGNLSALFTTIQSQTGYAIKWIYPVTISGVLNYFLISNCVLFLYSTSTGNTHVVYTNTAVFTSSCIYSGGILISDCVGNVYNFAGGYVNIIGNLPGIITTVDNYLTSTYIGISTLSDTKLIQNRKRIYQLVNGSFIHQVWSQNIPEPEVTFIYGFPLGLLIGSYQESVNPPYGELYTYINAVLQQLSGFPGQFRPDAAYYSNESGNVYVAFSGGSAFWYATYENGVLSDFSDTGMTFIGNIVQLIGSTSEQSTIIVLTDLFSYVFNENSFVVTSLPLPGYSSIDQQGLFVQIQNLNLGLANYQSSFIQESFSNVNFDPLLNGYNGQFLYSAGGQIVFEGISTIGYSTSFFIQYPQNSAIQSLTFNGQPQVLTNGSFSALLQNNTPVDFSLVISGENIQGVGTIILYNGVSSTNGSPVMGISSFIAPKTLGWYFRSGGELDIFGYSDGSLREADIADISSNTYTVYARFWDQIGNQTVSNYPSDYIYNTIQQQIDGQNLPSGRILEINPNLQYNNITQYVPPEGNSNFIYSGTKLVQAQGTFTSDPFFVSGLVGWQQIQVLCSSIPGFNEIPNASTNYGCAVILSVKSADSLIDLNNQNYTNSYELSTISGIADFGSQICNITANISSLNGAWLQFMIQMITESANVTPVVQSVLLTYTGGSGSFFVTKTFNTTTQSNITPAPMIRRGVLTSSFVTNGGQVTFGYTVNSADGNPADYTPIPLNEIFTLPEPSSQIKIGVILLSGNSNPAFMDSMALQLDLGPNDVYFMPAQAFFEVQQYINSQGVAVSHTYSLINKSLGLVSGYNFNFGTTYPIGIQTFIPYLSNPGLANTLANPTIGFAFTGTQTVGLTVTSWTEDINGNMVSFTSDPYTVTFIST